jgi:hypothetical protein
MAQQILAGSKGKYAPKHIDPNRFGKTEFTVTQDTCAESMFIVVKFIDAAEPCRLLMKDVTFTDLKTSDYQGAS